MTKEKYQITEKSIWLSLITIRHDLEDYDHKLNQAPKNLIDSINELRCIRDTFVTLKNLNDNLKRVMKITANEKLDKLREKTKLLHSRVDFVDHIRNKSAGHIDGLLSERAAQWAPEIFYDHTNQQLSTYFCYRALLESSINSFLGPNGRQKIFDHEIDTLYPPDHDQFHKFLKTLITDSIDWLNDAIILLDTTITKHGSSSVPEMAMIAGQTNFNLAENSSYEYDLTKLIAAVEQMKSEMHSDVFEAFMERLK